MHTPPWTSSKYVPVFMLEGGESSERCACVRAHGPPVFGSAALVTRRQTLADLARIRVAVVPIGSMSAAKFASYVSLIRQFSAVALTDLSISLTDSLPGARPRGARPPAGAAPRRPRS